MDTATRTLASLAALLLAVLASGCGGSQLAPLDMDDDDGNASAGLVTLPPNDAVQASFTDRSYAPGSTATLRLRGHADHLELRLYRAGAGSDGPLEGALVGAEEIVPGVGELVSVPLGAWPSGLYYAKVTTPGHGQWYAPFVLRPQKLGTNRVLVVLPTNTWQAYNFYADDSWYANARVHTIDLTRPYVDRGVPPHYTGYDRGFMRWLAQYRHAADFLSDDDLDRAVSGRNLARAYDLVIFSGHEEYVTEHEFDVVEQYRNLGGNLAFLSANNFFYKVVKHGDSMEGRWRWRDLGRPEASLVGSQYVDWNHDRYPNVPYAAADVRQAPWLFRGTGLRNGATFGKYGIEVDAATAASPHGTRVLAQIRGIFGSGTNAQMTYYTTPRGAKVFAAGVMNFGGTSLWPVVRTMMTNVWDELSRP
jgi:N,N-dimethylformamidase beta subunit-like protein